MKKWLRDKIIFPFLEMLPDGVVEKMKLMGTCTLGNGWGYCFLAHNFAREFKGVSAEEVRTLYSDVSEHSLKVLLDYLAYTHLSLPFCEYMDTTDNDSIIIPLYKIFPGLREKTLREKKTCRHLARKSCFKNFASEVCCYHHGLTLVNTGVHSYIRDTVFLDLGAFDGDSAFFLSRYAPELILSFEPSTVNGALYRENMKRSGIENVELIQAGVSDEAAPLLLAEQESGSKLSSQKGYQVDVVTIDDFLKESPRGRIGLIKADLEGMGLKMVKGAIETIKRDRPVLLLSIYHNRDEFMGIYQYLKENIPNYQYQAESLRGISEVTLIAYPSEIG